jgi:NAD(P)H dehydrogenase (quinone)
MVSTMSLLVTGAAGKLGRRVLQLLLARHAGPIIATTRNPEALADFAAQGVDVRRADFTDPASLASAFRGARRALLISTDDLAPGRRLGQHQAAVRGFAAAGVEHVVYTSLVNAGASSVAFAPDHAGTEAALADSRLDFTILQNSLYTDLLQLSLPPALATGKLVDARGDGALAWITREDCARTAAAALADTATGRRSFQITGSEALTSADLARLASEIFARPVEHVRVPVEAVAQAMVDHGAPRPLAEVYASIDTAIARGELATVTDSVRALTGTPAQTVRDYLIANRAAFV